MFYSQSRTSKIQIIAHETEILYFYETYVGKSYIFLDIAAAPQVYAMYTPDLFLFKSHWPSDKPYYSLSSLLSGESTSLLFLGLLHIPVFSFSLLLLLLLLL